MSAPTRKQQLEEMLAGDPANPFLRYALGMEQVSAGDLESAVRGFTELLAATPTYVPAYLQAAQALVRLDRLEEAREVLQRGTATARQQRDQHAESEMQALLDSLG